MKPLHNEGDIIRCRSCGGPAVRQSLLEVHYCNDCRPVEIENEETPIRVIYNEGADVPKKETFFERLRMACGDDLTDQQKAAIIRYSKHVVWKKVDLDFESLIVKQQPKP